MSNTYLFSDIQSTSIKYSMGHSLLLKRGRFYYSKVIGQPNSHLVVLLMYMYKLVVLEIM